MPIEWYAVNCPRYSQAYGRDPALASPSRSAALRYFGVGRRDRRQISPASTKQATPQMTKTVSKRGFEPSFGEKAQVTAHAANSATTPVHARSETTAARTGENASAATNCR